MPLAPISCLPIVAQKGGNTMLSTTHRVADAMKRAQLALQHHLRELEQIVAPPVAEKLPEVRIRLKAVLGLVTEHFRIEEQDGYMQAVKEQDQRFESDLKCLREEHSAMKRELELLIDEADALQQMDDEFSEKIYAWIDRFRMHEKSEIDLVQEAFDVDVGGEGG
jgi:hypothetical protein